MLSERVFRARGQSLSEALRLAIMTAAVSGRCTRESEQIAPHGFVVTACEDTPPAFVGVNVNVHIEILCVGAQQHASRHLDLPVRFLLAVWFIERTHPFSSTAGRVNLLTANRILLHHSAMHGGLGIDEVLQSTISHYLVRRAIADQISDHAPRVFGLD